MDIPQSYKEVQPLVIRADLGDTVKIRFRNSLNRRLSIHVQGLSHILITFREYSLTRNEKIYGKAIKSVLYYISAQSGTGHF